MFKVVLFSNLLVMYILITKSYADEDIYYDRGWVPVPNEVFLKLWKDYTPNNNFKDEEKNTIYSRIPALNIAENIHSLRDSALQIVKPQFINDLLTNEEILSNPTELEKFEPIKYFHNRGNNCLNKAPTDCLERRNQENTRLKVRSTPETFKIKINESTAIKAQRTAKKISEQVLVQDFVGNSIKNGDTKSNINELETSKRELFSNKANDTVGKNQNTYEVTENSDGIDLLNAEQTEVSDNSGYTYKPIGFNIQSLDKNAFISKFLDKLANNKIKVNESLPNYALSRIKNYNIANKPTDITIQIPFRHNSLNHLPVNPITAVFLSNYGYYLPGFYGLQNNYRNLYGYLASNNIHNNMPYGLYKVFSDTDSAN